MNGKQKEALKKYSSVLRVPPEIARPIVTMFCNFLEKNGNEWTVNRFKSVKNDFIRLRAGETVILTSWIAKEANHFKGHIGSLQNWAMRDDRNFAEAIQLLQIYTTLIASEVTQAQSTKFVDAVQYENINVEYFDHYNNLLLRAASVRFPRKAWYADPGSLLFYPVSDQKNEPHASGKSFPEGSNTLNCAQSFLDGTFVGRQMMEDFPQLFRGVLAGVAVHCGSGHCEWEYPNTVGKIGLIQEPGYKLRAVANPARVYQVALQPLGDSLYGMLKTLPWDCTHNQEYPVVAIQQRLINGKTAHAVDLSNATDRFPFEFQYRLLIKLFHRTDAVELFAALSRANWSTSLTPEGVISWKTGQPLGLYPSFASFALTHGLMLFALNGFDHKGDFYVLGDDVIILDDALFYKYRRFLEDMDIPFSPSKTISSPLLTEFGGKLISKDKVIPQLKWRNVSDDSFIDLAKHFGERFRYLMLPRQRRVFDIVKVIPDFLGGCGLNPSGIPLEDRCALYYDKLYREDLQSYMLSYNGRISSMNHEQLSPKRDGTFRQVLRSTPVSGHWFLAEPPIHAFDQKALSLASELTPLLPYTRIGRWTSFPWRETFGNLMYFTSPRERSLRISGQGSGCTNLEVLERKLFH